MGLTGGGNRRDIEVTGLWSGAFNGTVTGDTNPTGKVTFTAPAISEDTITFRVLTVSHSEYAYQPSLNVITQITVSRADA